MEISLLVHIYGIFDNQFSSLSILDNKKFLVLLNMWIFYAQIILLTYTFHFMQNHAYITRT